MTNSLTMAPLVPLELIAVLAAAGLSLAMLAFLRGARGWLIRVFVLVLLVGELINLQVVRENREVQPDIAVILVDRSASQDVGNRRSQTKTTLAKIKDQLSRFDDLEIRIIEVSNNRENYAQNLGNDAGKGTQMFTALAREMTEIPGRRFAGAILITDGQIHDIPDLKRKTPLLPQGPIHVLLTGTPNEMDRRLVIEQAASYGIVGNEVTVRYRVEDRLGQKSGHLSRRLAEVKLRYNEDKEIVAKVPIGHSKEFKFKLEHAGLTVAEVLTDAVPGELSSVNNRALIKINGVRDRLRVLLVSGQPHAGERTWRNLLKSDLSVDLVHFTILRPPEKNNFTPLQELALIAFPIKELFEVKLPEFDLIVFDRYVVRNVLPSSYLNNIVKFVQGGGALLLAAGPEFSSLQSLYKTPLGKILPATPTGRVLEGGFHPRLSAAGFRHPVTKGLQRSDANFPYWGRWFRQIEATAKSGQVLMWGIDDRPLLLLDRKGRGRVAQLLSDHIWLWARGFEGGGPQAELMRRLAHWLMKEPDLEEESLRAKIQGQRLLVERQSLGVATAKVTVTFPSGETRILDLEDTGAGTASGFIKAPMPGLYRVSDGSITVLETMGALNPLEFRNLQASADNVGDLAKASGGGLHWITNGIPNFRRTRPQRDSHGESWFGLVANQSFVVSGLVQVPLIPGLWVMILTLGIFMLAWHREGR